MNEVSLNEEKDKFAGDPEAALELMYIDEYLQERGYTMKDLCALPEEEAKRLMIEACRYASFRLAEVESRAKFRKEIHYTPHSA